MSAAGAGPPWWKVGAIQPEDPSCGFSCGKRPLDRYFQALALSNEEFGVGRTFVMRQDGARPELPRVLGYYTLAQATIEPSDAAARAPPWRRGSGSVRGIARIEPA